MTDKEAVQVLAILKAAYPNSYKGMTKEEAKGTATVWAVQFANIPVEVVLIAVNKLIATSPFPPAICDVKKKFSSIYHEADDHIRLNERMGGTGNKHIEFYKMVRDVTEKDRFYIAEPTILEVMGGNDVLMIGGGKE